MSSPPVPAPPSAPAYYRATDRVSPRLWVVLPLVGGGVAAALGTLYAFLCGLVTQVFESPSLFAIVTPLFGAALALGGQGVCYLGQVRRRRWRLPIALVVGVLGLYAGWHAYLNLVDVSGVFDPAPSWTMSPLRLAHALGQFVLNEGVLGPFGVLLEAAVVLGMITFLTRSLDVEVPFCERCGKWTSEAFQLELAGGNEERAAERLKRGDPEGLAKLPRRKPGESFYGVVRVFRCPCGASRFVSVDRAKVTRGRRSGVKYSPILPGGRPRLQFDPGSGDTTDLTPVLANLVIDERAEQALEAVRAKP